MSDNSSDRLQQSIWSRRQASSSSKNAGPFCELKKLKLFDLTGKDLQCFSHEDGCFAPNVECTISLSDLLQSRTAKFSDKHTLLRMLNAISACLTCCRAGQQYAPHADRNNSLSDLLQGRKHNSQTDLSGFQSPTQTSSSSKNNVPSKVSLDFNVLTRYHSQDAVSALKNAFSKTDISLYQ